MNISINSEGHELSAFATKVLRRKIGAVLNRMSRFGESRPVELKVSGQGDQVLVEANVVVGRHQLYAAKKSHHEVDAVNGCINALLRQFDKVRLASLPMLREKTRIRQHARKNGAERSAASLPKGNLSKIPSQIIEELYPSLRRMATEKVAFYQATTSIEPGFLDPDEIVDDVLVEMIETLDPGADAVELRKRFFRGIEELIQCRIRGYEADSANLVSTDGELLDVDEKIELSNLGDEVLDFWVLDEQLFLEDVMEAPDLRSPEDIVADKEARHVLMNALLRLPPRWRYIFTSYIMDENSIEDVAAFVGTEVEETEQILRSSIQLLRSHLTEAATMISGESVVALYRRMSEMFHADPLSISRTLPPPPSENENLSAAAYH